MKFSRKSAANLMHELSVAQALLDQIEIVAQARGALDVPAATIRVGPLSGVEPSLLRRAFEVARLARPTTARTELTLEIGEIVVSCASCGRNGSASPGDLRCQHCASVRTSMRTGDELLLLRIEMDIPAAGAAEMAN